MGWRMADLPVVTKAKDRTDTCRLMTMGGINGVEIHIDDNIIHLGKEVLLRLFADHLITEEISKLEQMEGTQAIDYLLSRLRFALEAIVKFYGGE